MAIVLIADIPGMTTDGYRNVLKQVKDRLTVAPGFVAHAGTATATGFRVTEIWESREDCIRFLEGTVLPLASQAGIPPFQPEFIEAVEAFTR